MENDQASNVPVSDQLVNNFPREGAPKSKIPLIALVVLLVVIGGAAVYAYKTDAFISLPNLVNESMEKSQTATSVVYDSSVSIDFSEIKEANAESLASLGIMPSALNLSFIGSIDKSDPKNLRSNSTASLKIGPINLTFDIRIINNVIYIKLAKAPIIPTIPIPLSMYENKWFSFSSQKNEEFYRNQDEFSNILRDGHYIKAEKKLSSETVDGVLTYHLSFDLDREGIVAYIEKIKHQLDNLNGPTKVDTFDTAKIKEIFDQIKNFKGEVWIGHNDKLIRKVTMNFGFQPDPAKDEQAKLNMTILYKNWNEPVTVAVPEDSTPFEQLISGMMPGAPSSIENANQKASEAQIKSNLSSLRAQAEIFYDRAGSYEGFCSSPELKMSRNSIEHTGGTKFICKDTAGAYAVSAKLPGNSGYWCVDSTGASNAQSSSLSGTACAFK